MRIYNKTASEIEKQIAFFNSVGKTDVAEGMRIAMTIIRNQARRTQTPKQDPALLVERRRANLVKARAVRAAMRNADASVASAIASNLA